MKLNIQERLLVLNVLPKEGTYANVREIRKALEIVALHDDDLQAIDFIPETEKYDQAKAEDWYKDLPLSEWVSRTIQTTLIKMEKEGKLPITMATIYEKFVVDHE